MTKSLVTFLLAGVALAAPFAIHAKAEDANLSKIKNVVVIYAENRSFDNLYGLFPGADGVANLKPEQTQQVDRDGKPFAMLPPAWDGLTSKGVTPVVGEADTKSIPNGIFRIDDPKGFNLPSNLATRDLWHKFYQEQMQIDGGKNDKFAAWSDGGGAAMGYYDGSGLPLWKVAQKYVLADHFFLGAFGGSFLNHFYLVCACAPVYPDAANSVAKGKIAAVEDDGVTLKVKNPSSAMDAKPKDVLVNDGAISPDGYAVNTMSPPYQPAYVKPAEGGDAALANPNDPFTMPPQTLPNIGEQLSAKNVTWTWYAGAWDEALAGKGIGTAVPNFQAHHQPFNYMTAYAPGTPARAEHLRDGGLGGKAFIADIDAGKLPSVSYYKPQGDLNEHTGYTDVSSGDQHIADVIAHLEKSPQWADMVVVVTYDENGGWWDHVAPPKADRWGPGNRVPALIISPYAKMGTVDHTQYDTSSILRFITKRWNLDPLPGLKLRDAALAANSQAPIGDLTAALKLE